MKEIVSGHRLIWPTLSEAKHARMAELLCALSELRRSLEGYAKTHRGRFVLFGSTARGEFRLDSDVDILVDFGPTGQSAAWQFAESECYRLGLSPDVRPASMCSTGFLDSVARRAHEEIGV